MGLMVLLASGSPHATDELGMNGRVRACVRVRVSLSVRACMCVRERVRARLQARVCSADAHVRPKVVHGVKVVRHESLEHANR